MDTGIVIASLKPPDLAIDAGISANLASSLGRLRYWYRLTLPVVVPELFAGAITAKLRESLSPHQNPTQAHLNAYQLGVKPCAEISYLDLEKHGFFLQRHRLWWHKYRQSC